MVRRCGRLRQASVIFLFALATLPAAAADLAEPGEPDMRRAYAAYLQQSFAKQGTLLDPRCNVAGKGCSVVLLDIRRDYRLKQFKKRKCDPERPIGFACSFQATVACAYSSNGKPNPLVADIYCGPLFNKPSVYNAVFEYDRGGWTIARFTQG